MKLMKKIKIIQFSQQLPNTM